jgi:hypothetical protein
LQREPTDTERKFWYIVRGRKFDGSVAPEFAFG